MSKKHVKAPLTYNPGKGRPKEHLAYLNYQEMQALKRLNGNNMEMGPKGLPSFPPNDAIGSSSKATSTSSSSGTRGSGTSTSYGGTSTKSSSSSYGSSGTRYGGASTYSGGSGGSKTTTSSSTRTQSGVNDRTGGGGGNRTSSGSSSGFSGGRSGFSGAGTNAVKDTAARQAAVTKDAVKVARDNQPFNSDASKGGIKSINVGPMGTSVAIGGNIKGAIAKTAEAAKKATQPRDSQGPIPSTVKPTQYGWASTGPSMLAAHQAQNIYGGKLAAQGRTFTQQQYNTLLDANTITNPSLNKQTSALSDTMRRNAAILSSAAKMRDMDPELAIGMGAAESALGTAADRVGSQYRGLTQMGDNEWASNADQTSRKLGRDNPWASAQAGVSYADKNRQQYKSAFGTEPSLADVYGMHQQGAAGYIGLRSNPNAPASSIVGIDRVRANLPDRMSGIAGSISAGAFANHISSYPEKKLAELSGVPKISTAQSLTSTPPAPKPVDDRIISIKNADGSIVSSTADDFANFMTSAGATPAEAAMMRNSLVNAKTPQIGVGRNLTQTANGLVPRGVDLSGSGYGTFNVPRTQPTDAGLAGTGYGTFNVPRTQPTAASLAGTGYGTFNVPKAPEAEYRDPAVVAGKPAEQGAPSVQLTKMDAPDMPGAPQGTKVKTDQFTIKPGSVPAAAMTTIVDAFKNPEKIDQIAKEQGWRKAGDAKTLASIKKDIESLKKAGATVTPDGKNISIPKSAAAKAQATFNKVATAYSMFGSAAPGYGETFDKGLGKVTNKSTVTTTKPPSADEMSKYDMAMSDYRDAMRGLAMSPSLQKPDAKYASAVAPKVDNYNVLSGVQTPQQKQALAAASDMAGAGARSIAGGISTLFSSPAEAATTPLRGTAGTLTSVYDKPALAQAAGTLTSVYDQKPLAQAAGTLTSVYDKPALARAAGTLTSPYEERPEVRETISTPKGDMTVKEFVQSRDDLTTYEKAKLADSLSDYVASGVTDFSYDSDVLNSIVAQAKGTEVAQSPSQEPAGPAYDSTITPEAEQAQQDERKRVNRATRIAGGLGAISGVPGLGLAGAAIRYADAQVQKLVDKYQDASIAERAEMEKKYPNLIAHATAMGIQTGGGTMDDYRAWASKMGLRDASGGFKWETPGNKTRGAPSDDYGIVEAATGGSSGGSSSNKDNGLRPYLHYQWDLGINIPSPGDANYTEYMRYLALKAGAFNNLGVTT